MSAQRFNCKSTGFSFRTLRMTSRFTPAKVANCRLSVESIRIIEKKARSLPKLRMQHAWQHEHFSTLSLRACVRLPNSSAGWMSADQSPMNLIVCRRCNFQLPATDCDYVNFNTIPSLWRRFRTANIVSSRCFHAFFFLVLCSSPAKLLLHDGKFQGHFIEFIHFPDSFSLFPCTAQRIRSTWADFFWPHKRTLDICRAFEWLSMTENVKNTDPEPNRLSVKDNLGRSEWLTKKKQKNWNSIQRHGTTHDISWASGMQNKKSYSSTECQSTCDLLRFIFECANVGRWPRIRMYRKWLMQIENDVVTVGWVCIRHDSIRTEREKRSTVMRFA